MNPKKKAYEIQATTIIKKLEKRGMEGYYFENRDLCVEKIISMMPKGSKISWGGSMTFHETGLSKMIDASDYELFDRYSVSTPEEQREIYSKIVMCDYFFMSTNAITLDGELINIDGNGNRLACLMQGPQNVMIIAGMNKLVGSVEAGIQRVKNIASPPNAIRLNKETPCTITGKCENCFSPDCICSHTVITRRSGKPGRIKIFLIGEDLGY